MSNIKIAAITGRSGTGKSFAAKYLAEKGIPTIDCDVIAREVQRPGERCLEELVAEFGEEILNADGTLNRKMLGDICFSDEEKKKRLNAITHPFIAARLFERFGQLHAKGIKGCLIEAPTLVESGLDAACGVIIMITADEDVAIERIVKRDGLTEERAKARIRSQIDEEALFSVSDIVIDNSGSKQEFVKQLDALAESLKLWFEE